MATPVNAVGFGQKSGTFTIGTGADGSAVDPVDLERSYAFHRLYITDCSNIQASTTLGVELGFTDSDTMVDAYDNSDTTAWASGNLPTSGAFTMLLPPELTMGAQRVRVVLSQVTSGGTAVFTIYGFDAGLE